MSKLRAEVIKYSKKLNITNLSALRSGNISIRAKEKGVDGPALEGLKGLGTTGTSESGYGGGGTG